MPTNAEHQAAHRARQKAKLAELEAEVARLRGGGAAPDAKKPAAPPEPPRPAPPPPPRSQPAYDEVADLKSRLRLREEELAKARKQIADLQRRPPEVAESEAIRKLESMLKAANTKAGNERARANSIELKSLSGPNFSEDDIMVLLKVCHPDKGSSASDADRNAATKLLLRKRTALRNSK